MANTDTEAQCSPPMISYFDKLDMKEVLRPKTVEPYEFVSLMHDWLEGRRIKIPTHFPRHRLLPASEIWERVPGYAQMIRELMNHLPIQQDQLAIIPELLPPGPIKSWPPFMSLGWVVSIDEIKRQGQAKNLCQQDRILEYYPQDDPDRPKEAVFDHESGCYKYEPPPTFSPIQTLDALLTEGKVACGLYKKGHAAYYQEYFTVASIWNSFGKCFEDMMFINIYTNIDLLKDRSRKGNASRDKAEIPGRTEIKAMQKWLGIEEDREPGWWFLSYLWDDDLCDYVRR